MASFSHRTYVIRIYQSILFNHSRSFSIICNIYYKTNTLNQTDVVERELNTTKWPVYKYIVGSAFQLRNVMSVCQKYAAYIWRLSPTFLLFSMLCFKPDGWNLLDRRCLPFQANRKIITFLFVFRSMYMQLLLRNIIWWRLSYSFCIWREFFARNTNMSIYF